MIDLVNGVCLGPTLSAFLSPDMGKVQIKIFDNQPTRCLSACNAQTGSGVS